MGGGIGPAFPVHSAAAPPPLTIADIDETLSRHGSISIHNNDIRAFNLEPSLSSSSIHPQSLSHLPSLHNHHHNLSNLSLPPFSSSSSSSEAQNFASFPPFPSISSSLPPPLPLPPSSSVFSSQSGVNTMPPTSSDLGLASVINPIAVLPPPPSGRHFDVGELRINHVASRSALSAGLPTIPTGFPAAPHPHPPHLAPPPPHLPPPPHPHLPPPAPNSRYHEFFHPQQQHFPHLPLQQQHHQQQHQLMSQQFSSFPATSAATETSMQLKRERMFEQNPFNPSPHYPYDMN